ncbi:DNA repair protein RecN [Ottowia sp.]|uniref:DNA repair protein RecN n=1 Tax=Ottowia sp. TaxID=1898956 RepID=UPI002C718519|nr:DNA repair protein RecN [Ottowia sp.]HRN75062.1 DNA repair protein RecN [Ottowia sp.]HRQ02166.1 DNA repair protein RecN [Ottowia sp.]
MALRHLMLRDFVIVPALELDLHEGFTALTGETGAGKSILVDALQLVLGGRGDALWVREGQPRCEIGAEFDAPPPALPWLEANGFEVDASELLLRRTIGAAGKSRAWINGSPATLTQLRELADWLLDIHGQHAWQSLTRPAAIRALLDAYAGVDTAPLAEAWQHWQQAQAALQRARAAQGQLAQERERLTWQIGELDKLAPREDEWDELNQQHTRLSHAQALIDAAQTAAAALEGDDAGTLGALPALAQAQEALQAESGIEPEFTALVEVLEASAAQARDTAHSLHAYLRRADLDPDQLAELDQRMGQWVGLARRFRRPPEELPALLAGWRTELAQLESSADLDRLQRDAQQQHAAYLQVARQVSAQRAKAAPRLADAVTAAMQDLGMAGGRFEVSLQPLAEPTAHGLEGVAFLVAAHAGSTPRAIEKVASGGELSRLALAIAVTTSQLGEAGTLVFDEVDAGVGGAVAATVGRLLRRLGQDRQVLCVTHLPQVAACANRHLLVSKQAGSGGTTTSAVNVVEGEARTREIARMLGGERISEATLAHALEMLQSPAASSADQATPSKRGRKARA